MVLLTTLGELITRILRGTRLGSDGVLAGTGVSGSGVWSESGIKSSVIRISLLFNLIDLSIIMNKNKFSIMFITMNIYLVMSL